MDFAYLRGEIYYANLGVGVGSEQEGYRPVVIVQNDLGNRYSPTVIVAPLSSKVDGRTDQPTHCYIKDVDGLNGASVILTEQLRTIDKSRIHYRAGKLDDTQMKALNESLAVSVGLRRVSAKKMIMCLCGVCMDNFLSTGKVRLRRVDISKNEKETCTYCNTRKGYDYELIYIKERRRQEYGNKKHD